MDGWKRECNLWATSSTSFPTKLGDPQFLGGEKKNSTLLGSGGLATSSKQMGLSFRKT
jgi:hypothetical protein